VRYTITVSAVPDEKTAKILARYITSRGDRTSFNELIEMLQHEEYRYALGVTKSEMLSIQEKLSALNVEITVTEMEEPVRPPSQTVVKPEIEMVQKVPRTVHNKDGNEPVEKKQETTLSPSSGHKINVRKKRTIHFVVSLSGILLVFLIIFIFILGNKGEQHFDIREGSGNSSLTGTSSAPSEQPLQNGTSAENASNEALDSADNLCMSSGVNTEKFYRFAIEYNPQNLDAWFGLLNCYQSTNRSTEASRIRSEMQQRFGANILEPSRYLNTYGDLEVIKLSLANGSLVYRSNETSLNMLYGELFRITRRISAVGTVKSLTVLAKMSDGTGIFMTISLGSCIEYYDFIEQGTFQEMQ